jgi:chromosome segregation ATPase
MTNNQNITSKYEQERLRAAEQSQIVYLQGQIDELRRLIKDQTNKYNWAMEQVRRVEGGVAQIEGILDRHRQEIAQSLEGYRRDITTLRREVANALVKAEEGIKPIREMQTQIHQLGETRKQDRDQVAGWLLRIEDLEQRTLNWHAQIHEAEEQHRSLAAKLDGLHGADDDVRIEVRKFNEDLQVERQNLRRQAVEAQQLVADVRNILDNHHSRIVRLDEIRQHIEQFAEHLPGQITAVEGKVVTLVDEIKRIERMSTERFLMNQERLEEVRHQNDERLEVLQETDEQHLRQLTAWLERIDGLVRELEQRVNRSTARVEVAQREQAAHIAILDQRGVQVIDALAAAVREQAEKLKADQIARGAGE